MRSARRAGPWPSGASPEGAALAAGRRLGEEAGDEHRGRSAGYDIIAEAQKRCDAWLKANKK